MSTNVYNSDFCLALTFTLRIILCSILFFRLSQSWESSDNRRKIPKSELLEIRKIIVFQGFGQPTLSKNNNETTRSLFFLFFRVFLLLPSERKKIGQLFRLLTVIIKKQKEKKRNERPIRGDVRTNRVTLPALTE